MHFPSHAPSGGKFRQTYPNYNSAQQGSANFTATQELAPLARSISDQNQSEWYGRRGTIDPLPQARPNWTSSTSVNHNFAISYLHTFTITNFRNYGIMIFAA